MGSGGEGIALEDRNPGFQPDSATKYCLNFAKGLHLTGF